MFRICGTGLLNLPLGDYGENLAKPTSGTYGTLSSQDLK